MRSFPDHIRELWELLRSYAMQELFQPMKGLPWYVGLGLAGAFTTAVGVGLLLLSALRVLQSEVFEASAEGGSSSLPYFIVGIGAILATLLLARRINRQFREPS